MYAPLPNGHIRILTIIFGGLVPTCSLQSVHLQSKLGFDALSYCCGVGEWSEEILCNGSSFRVSRTLHDAINNLTLRAPETYQYYPQQEIPPSFSRPIWIDAICINQNDTNAKNCQVPLIGDIYSSAKVVIAWFGQGDTVIATACSLLPDLVEKLSEVGTAYKGSYGSSLPEEFGRFGLLPLQHQVWGGIRKVYQNPYFNRVWILQEATLVEHSLWLMISTT